MNKEKKYGNRLFINPFIRAKEKHPSIKNLILNDQQKINIKNDEELNNYFKKVKDDEKKNDVLNFNDKNNCNYCFNIFNVETELYNPNNNFYILNDNNDIKNKELYLYNTNNQKNNSKINNKNLYYFNEEQLKLDYKITNQIKCNQNYEKIEKNFIPFLNISKVE